MSSQSKARSRRLVSLKVTYDLKTGTFQMPAYIQITPDEFMANPAVKYLQEAAHSVGHVAQLQILDGGHTNV